MRALRSFETLTQGKRDEKGNVISGPYMEIPEDIKVPKSWQGRENEYFQNKFLSFLDQDAWKDIKKYIYSTDTNVLAEAGEAIARGAKLSDLRDAYKAYLRKEIDVFTMWQNWTSIK